MRHVAHGDPFHEIDVSARLDEWADVLDEAIQKLEKTLAEVRAAKQKGQDTDDVSGTSDAGG